MRNVSPDLFAWVAVDGRPGQLVPVEDARISVRDRGVTIGEGIFETCKVVSQTRCIGFPAVGVSLLFAVSPSPGQLSLSLCKFLQALFGGLELRFAARQTVCRSP